jgi:hypothetical protein
MMLTDHLWEKRGIDEGIIVTMSEGAWLGKPEMREGYIIGLKKFTPLAGGHRTNIQNIEMRKAVTVESALKNANELILIGDKKYSPKRQAKFVWQTSDKTWKWEATKYEGNGIFFGKVTSPIVPEGEWGTWYVWEVEQHAKLIEGDSGLLAKLKEKSKKAQRMQQAILG